MQGLIKGRTKYERTIAGGRRHIEDDKFFFKKKFQNLVYKGFFLFLALIELFCDLNQFF